MAMFAKKQDGDHQKADGGGAPTTTSTPAARGGATESRKRSSCSAGCRSTRIPIWWCASFGRRWRR